MTPTPTPELKPCPFCGGAVDLRTLDKDLYGNPVKETWYFIECIDGECAISSYGATQIEVTTRWNTRTESAEPLSLRAQVESQAKSIEYWKAEAVRHNETAQHYFERGESRKGVQNDKSADARRNRRTQFDVDYA